jgi:hypothetical protein
MVSGGLLGLAIAFGIVYTIYSFFYYTLTSGKRKTNLMEAEEKI